MRKICNVIGIGFAAACANAVFIVMTERGYVIIDVFVTATGTNVSSIALLGAGRFGDLRYIIVNYNDNNYLAVIVVPKVPFNVRLRFAIIIYRRVREIIVIIVYFDI